MTKLNKLQKLVFPSKDETQAIQELEQILHSGSSQPKLVGLDREEIAIPDSVYCVLRQVIEMMASGRAVYLVPLEHELTTQEAAELLNVSRPFLIKLLEQRAIPYSMVGTHRRIRYEDLIAYKEQRDNQRRDCLKRLTQLSEEMGLYDDEDEDNFNQEEANFKQDDG